MSIKFFFWRNSRASRKWQRTLSAMVNAWRQGKSTVMITRTDPKHYFDKVHWFTK